MAIDVRARLNLSEEALAVFCRKWKIVRLELFGSALREDFGDESDIDLMVTFEPDASWRFEDELAMQKELERLLGRNVDMPVRGSIEKMQNWVRRKNILSSARVIYSA
ncbi:MAG TPA: nucleotidyltransferase domain-containing protein [Dehalococcoidia bacterium]|jgi:predicted nucleotidyltransferase|nr:nucleotidyltransferase domain-containing protein [Dehalococcoidia bacterium]